VLRSYADLHLGYVTLRSRLKDDYKARTFADIAIQRHRGTESNSSSDDRWFLTVVFKEVNVQNTFERFNRAIVCDVAPYKILSLLCADVPLRSYSFPPPAVCDMPFYRPSQGKGTDDKEQKSWKIRMRTKPLRTNNNPHDSEAALCRQCHGITMCNQQRVACSVTLRDRLAKDRAKVVTSNRRWYRFSALPHIKQEAQLPHR